MGLALLGDTIEKIENEHKIISVILFTSSLGSCCLILTEFDSLGGDHYSY